MIPPPRPTTEQIETHARIRWHDGHRYREGFACWYPQMGGYVGACVVELEHTDPPSALPCFNAFVWHDGDFPFADRSPVELHHCSAEQFVEFGELVSAKGAERLC